jgi:hypothetical protein
VSEAKDLARKEKAMQLGRYEYFGMANAWVKVIKRTDEGKLMTTAELIKKAMDDISSGDVDAEEIAKKTGKFKASPEGEVEEAKLAKEKDERAKE